jgi:phosphate transport system substrate-binding protein
MRKLAIIGFFALGLGVAPLAAQEKVIVGGAGTMGKGTAALAKAYLEKNPSDTVEVISEAMSTTGGIEGTKAGRVTVGIITRSVNEAEKSQGLVSRPVGRIPIVVGVHKTLPVSSLSDSQVCDIFSGKLKSWKDVGGADGKITVLGRTKDDNNMAEFRDKMGCFKTVQLTSDAVLLVRGSEVLDSLNNRPGTVAIVDAGGSMMERPNIKPLTISGAAPSLEAVRSGKYKYFNEIEFVTMGQPKGTAKKFIDFVTGPEGEKVLQKYGMASVR